MAFKLDIKLNQQTPIIHFQHDQAGATLRATEVKPKLDRFLTKQEGFDPAWCIKKTAALDYKLSFSSPPAETVELGPRTDYEIYYGNAGSDHPVKGVMANDAITMTVVCFRPELMEFIQKHLTAFFLCTNFGRMQSKGFGSYVPDGPAPSRQEIARALCRHYGAGTCYCFAAGNRPFARIKTIYTIMKSGISVPKRRTSLLFRYLWDKGIRNEKEGLMANDMAPAPRSFHGQQPPHHYVRALLGTADHYDCRGKKGSYSVVVAGGDIERFPSTIFFKVIGGTVYYIGKPIDPVIFDHPFAFTSTYDPTGRRRGHSTTKTFSTIARTEEINENFMTGFLAYCMEQLNDPHPADKEAALTQFRDMQGVRIEEVRIHG